MKRSDFAFEYDAYGYMLKYKGQNLGGVSTMSRKAKHWRHTRADLKMFHEQAEGQINSIIGGNGESRFLAVIAKIDG